MLTIHVWPKRLKEFLLTHPLYKSPLQASVGFLHVFLYRCDHAPYARLRLANLVSRNAKLTRNLVYRPLLDDVRAVEALVEVRNKQDSGSGNQVSGFRIRETGNR